MILIIFIIHNIITSLVQLENKNNEGSFKGWDDKKFFHNSATTNIQN